MNLEPLHFDKHQIDENYKHNRDKSLICLASLLILLIVTIFVSIYVGAINASIKEVILGLFNRSSDPKVNIIIQNNRLPRILTAILAGAGLGVTGCVLQAILHNPLASASTLGVSQGASFGAAFAIIILGLGSTTTSAFGIPLFAFVGSMAVAVIILALSRLRQMSPESIVLAGVAISAMFTGATTLMQYFADEVELASLIFWTFGDLSSTTWTDIRLLFVVVLLASIYFYAHRWDYNALLGGSETAISLGINLKALTAVSMIVCCFTASTIVSYVGLISFIGLVAPHIVRLIVGNNHLYLIPATILAGAEILLLADLFARTVISPIVLPIGALSSFLGGPIFLYLLFKGGASHARSK